MNRSILQYARSLIRRRKFGTAIQLLLGAEKDYKGSFEFYRMLGTCCLYVGDIDHASYYYGLARSIKAKDADLFIGQAAVFLHRGEVENALPYYLDVETLSPGNKIALSALEFLRENSDRTKKRTILLEWIQTGRIEKFYPPLGTNPDLIRNAIITGLLLGVCISIGIVIGGGYSFRRTEKKSPAVFVDQHKQNVQNLALTESELKNPRDTSLSEGMVTFEMTDKEITKAYDAARKYVEEHRDNAALVEINRIKMSNASASVKAKAESLKSQLFPKTVGFGDLKDNYSYRKDVNTETAGLYAGCYVIWDGRISNIRIMENGFLAFDFLVGYVDKKNLDGIVTVEFDDAPSSPLDTEKPIRILGIVDGIDWSRGDARIRIRERAKYQPMKDTDSLEDLH